MQKKGTTALAESGAETGRRIVRALIPTSKRAASRRRGHVERGGALRASTARAEATPKGPTLLAPVTRALRNTLLAALVNNADGERRALFFVDVDTRQTGERIVHAVRAGVRMRVAPRRRQVRTIVGGEERQIQYGGKSE